MRTTPGTVPAAPERNGPDEAGETLALLVLWPALLVAVLILVVHAFIVTNAQAEAEFAASQGLRAAWSAAANADFTGIEAPGGYTDYVGAEPHPDVLTMAEHAKDAVARAAATEGGWRWWTPGGAEVQSDWCYPYPTQQGLPPVGRRPGFGETGWVRVVVSGNVHGPLAALWPNRLDTVYAAAQGPAPLSTDGSGTRRITVPGELPAC